MLILIVHPNCCHFFCQNTRTTKDNKVNEAAEEKVKPGQATIPCKQFVDMIQPTFPPQATKQDVMVYIKRARWIVNLNQAAHVRKAGVNEEPVPLVTFPPNESDFISADGKKVFAAIREGISISPSSWLEKRQWKHDLISMVLTNIKTPPRAITIHGASMFGNQKHIVEKKREVAFSGRFCSLFAKSQCHKHLLRMQLLHPLAHLQRQMRFWQFCGNVCREGVWLRHDWFE